MTAATTESVRDDQTAQEAAEQEDLVLADLLVEEISIDGMCGVY